MTAELSPYTGWTRAHWVALADRMLGGVERYRSPHGARYDLPGPASGSGPLSDGLEGFARTFLLAGFRVAGERGAGPAGLLERYAEGLAAGTDPGGAEAWPRPDLVPQAKVEAASIALILQLTRPWLWDALDDKVKQRTVEWLGSVVGTRYPRCNWLWFRVVVESFLREVGGPWSAADIEEDLALHAALRRTGGWLSDNETERAYDHYVSWALHLYPLLWTHLFDVTGTLCPPALRDTWEADLARYLADAAALVGADGAPPFQGRSLTYRFAAAAPFWVGAYTGAGEQPPGLVRRIASGIARHFVDAGCLEPDGILTLGWHRAWPAMRQSYSGPGSPYWASKGMLGLALPADHPVWTDVELPLPVETGDVARAVTAPGWLVSARRDTGVATVLNHGTDHAVPGSTGADSPVYARLGYSTATAPVYGEPLDNAVVLLDSAGRPSHRSGFENLYTRELPGGVLAAASTGPVRWVDTSADAAPDHGSGRTGPVVPGPVVTVVSVLRDGVEVRLVRVAGGTECRLRLGGWPVAADTTPESSTADGPHATVAGPLRSTVANLRGFTIAGVELLRDAGPLGAWTAVPWLATDEPGGEILAAAVVLGGGTGYPTLTVANAPVLTWPDGLRTEIDLPKGS
jgi:hypothetical protein